MTLDAGDAGWAASQWSGSRATLRSTSLGTWETKSRRIGRFTLSLGHFPELSRFSQTPRNDNFDSQKIAEEILEFITFIFTWTSNRRGKPKVRHRLPNWSKKSPRAIPLITKYRRWLLSVVRVPSPVWASGCEGWPLTGLGARSRLKMWLRYIIKTWGTQAPGPLLTVWRGLQTHRKRQIAENKNHKLYKIISCRSEGLFVLTTFFHPFSMYVKFI